MNTQKRSVMMMMCLAVLVLGCISLATIAASLPWETPLNNLGKSLTGPTAKAIALIGLFVAGGLLVFGGELSDFGRRVTWLCLAISVMLAGGNFINNLGFSSTSGGGAIVMDSHVKHVTVS